MRNFNPNDFDIRKVIKDRVNLEDWVEYSKLPTDTPKLPIPVKVSRNKKYSPGWWNFCKNCLNECRP